MTTILRRKFANASAAEYAPFGQVGEAQFDRVFSSNVKGTLFSVQKAPPLISDGGAIVLTASIVGSKGFPANTVYAATKAAVRSFARTWTTDLKEREIRVNVVSPSDRHQNQLRIWRRYSLQSRWEIEEGKRLLFPSRHCTHEPHALRFAVRS